LIKEISETPVYYCVSENAVASSETLGCPFLSARLDASSSTSSSALSTSTHATIATDSPCVAVKREDTAGAHLEPKEESARMDAVRRPVLQDNRQTKSERTYGPGVVNYAEELKTRMSHSRRHRRRDGRL
jgi:hypothetical protein